MDTSEISWHRFLKYGDQYLKAASPKSGKSRFDTDVRYNLLSMSLEGYIMAILDFHKNLPDNHTYTDLIFGLDRVMPLEKSLRDRILKYESIQSICSIDKFYIAKPTEEELDDLKDAIIEIGEIAHSICKN